MRFRIMMSKKKMLLGKMRSKSAMWKKRLMGRMKMLKMGIDRSYPYLKRAM
jgi:hypothetical protein